MGEWEVVCIYMPKSRPGPTNKIFPANGTGAFHSHLTQTGPFLVIYPKGQQSLLVQLLIIPLKNTLEITEQDGISSSN